MSARMITLAKWKTKKDRSGKKLLREHKNLFNVNGTIQTVRTM